MCLEAPLTPYRAPKDKEVILSPMDNGQIQTSVIKTSTAEVYQKTSGILTIIQNHADDGCTHCISILKSALENIGAGGRTPVTALETKDRSQGPLNHAIEEYSR